MKQIILERPGELRLAEAAPPVAGDLRPGHALVSVARVGICGTDWHAYHGRQPFFSYPRVLGHELGVIVEAVNDPSSDLQPGDRCAVEPYLNCGHCIACRRGRENCCAELQVLGVHIDGGMRERIVVPANKLHRSEKLSLDQFALIETLAIGCHATDRAAVERDEWALVIGAGPIGMSVVPFVRAAGARPIVMDVSGPRLAFCRKHLSVEPTIDAAASDALAALHMITGGDLPTAVFDATGNAQSMMRAFDLVAPGGRLVFVGLFQGDVTFNDPHFHRREITVLASRNALPRDFVRIIGLVEQRVIDTTPWVTHRTPANGLVDVMRPWSEPSAGVVKAMVEF